MQFANQRYGEVLRKTGLDTGRGFDLYNLGQRPTANGQRPTANGQRPTAMTCVRLKQARVWCAAIGIGFLTSLPLAFFAVLPGVSPVMAQDCSPGQNFYGGRCRSRLEADRLYFACRDRGVSGYACIEDPFSTGKFYDKDGDETEEPKPVNNVPIRGRTHVSYGDPPPDKSLNPGEPERQNNPTEVTCTDGFCNRTLVISPLKKLRIATQGEGGYEDRLDLDRFSSGNYRVTRITSKDTDPPNPPITDLEVEFGRFDGESLDTRITLTTTGGEELSGTDVGLPSFSWRDSEGNSLRQWTTRRFSLDEQQGLVLTNRGVGKTILFDTWEDYFDETSGFHAVVRTPSTGRLRFGDGTDVVEGKNNHGGLIRLASDVSFQFTVGGTTYNSLGELPVGTQITIPNNTYTGTYRGIPGTFTVSSAHVTRYANDTFLMPGSFPIAFQPDGTLAEINALVIEAVPGDSDYLRFGYWLDKTDRNHWKVDTFAKAEGYDYFGRTLFTRGNVSGISGKASYEGPAIGRYVVNGREGEFAAIASLEAQFGSDTVSAAEQWLVQGEIDDFTSLTNRSHTSAMSGWRLALDPEDLGDNRVEGNVRIFRRNASAGQNNYEDLTTHLIGPRQTLERNTGELLYYHDGTPNIQNGVHQRADVVVDHDNVQYPSFAPVDGTTTGSGGEGKWNGVFYGPSGTQNANVVPTAVTGSFSGHFSNGSAVGAYAAEKQ